MLWLLKLLNPLVLEIREGKVSVTKGRVPSRALREIQGVISEAGIGRATVHADGAGRFHFSSRFPVDRRQPLRNILASL
jgi:hypothetical protein